MSNSLSDLNTHLFAQLNRLSNATVKGEALKEELERSYAITGLAKEVINTGRLVLDAQRQFDSGNLHLPHAMLEVKKK